MDPFTTFVFLHGITVVALVGLGVYCWRLRKAHAKMAEAWQEYSMNNTENIMKLLKAVRTVQDNQLKQMLGGGSGLAAALLGGVPGAGPDLSVTEVPPELDLPPQEEDTGEDDGLTTLGDIIDQ